MFTKEYVIYHETEYIGMRANGITATGAIGKNVIDAIKKHIYMTKGTPLEGKIIDIKKL